MHSFFLEHHIQIDHTFAWFDMCIIVRIGICVFLLKAVFVDVCGMPNTLLWDIDIVPRCAQRAEWCLWLQDYARSR